MNADETVNPNTAAPDAATSAGLSAKQAETRDALFAWLGEHMQQAVEVRDRLDAAGDRMGTALFQVKEAIYRDGADLVKSLGAVRAIECVQEFARYGLPAACVEEGVNVIRGQVCGMTLANYQEADSAASWLERFGPDARNATE